MFPDTGVSTSGFTGKFLHTILVVEDEEAIRMFLTEFLQDCGYYVIEAENVAQAKDVLIDRPVDVVFSDINMPGPENGFALEKWIRQHYANTKVLLTSGFPQAAEDTRDLLEPLIPKPYSIASVLQRIESLFCVENSLHG